MKNYYLSILYSDGKKTVEIVKSFIHGMKLIKLAEKNCPYGTYIVRCLIETDDTI